METVDIVNEVPASKGVEDRRTADAVVLGQLEIVANLPYDLGLAQHMTVVLMIL